jgi:hypothetical protein
MNEPFLLPENTALIINISIIGISLVLILIGYFRGFVSQAYDLVFLLIGFLLASLLSGFMATQVPILPASLNLTNLPFVGSVIKLWIDTVLWMIILTVLLWILSLLAKGWFIKKILRYEKKVLADHIAGAVVAVWPVVLVGIAFALLLSVPVIGNGKEILSQTLFSPFGSAATGVVDEIVTNNPVISVVDKLQNGEELNEEDLESIEDILKGMNFPQNVIDIAMKVLNGSVEALTEDDIQALLDYAEENNITFETVEGWLTEFGFSQEQIDELLGDYLQP